MRRFLILFVICLAGCTKPASISLTSPSSVSINYKGGSVTVSFSTNRPWSAGTAAGWATVSSRSGDAGDVSLVITVDETYDSEQRSVDVVLKAEDLVEKVSIVQEGRPTVEPDSRSFSVGSQGGYFTLSLRSNVDYSVDIPSSATWLRLVSTKSMVSHTAEFAVDPNPTTLARTAVITLRGGTKDEQVTLVQDGLEQQFRIVHNALSFTFPGLSGENVSGTVDWGYGDCSDPYKTGIGFSYPDVAARNVTFSGKNVTGVSVSDISNIRELDLSQL